MASNGMINGGEVSDRLGIKLTTEFISTHLGIEPDMRDKRASLYTEDSFVRICEELQAHAARVQSGHHLEAKEAKPRKAAAAPSPAVNPLDEEEDDGEL